MKSFVAAITALSLLSSVHAQYAIDPASVNNSTRQAWCKQQQSQCPLICSQTAAASSLTQQNTCDWVDLTFACVCSNGLSPNISEYSQTLPYYICQEWGIQCVANCGNGANDCAANCRQNHPCGAQNPTRQNSTSSTSGSSSSSSSGSSGAATGSATGTSTAPSGQVFTGFAQPSGSAAAGGNTDTQKSAGIRAAKVWALGVGQTFGTLGVVGALVGGMAVLL